MLAEDIHAEIISADSRQLFKYMDIGTAKPSPEDRRRIKHYFVDELLPDRKFNAGEFGKLGREIVEDIFSRGKIPLVVGGSGLYVQSLVDGFFEGPPEDVAIRKSLYERLRTEGPEPLLAELGKVDPVSACRMLPSNTRRIVRALEVFLLTGIPISQMQESRVEIDFVPCFTGLQWDRKLLYERINCRVDWMIKQGLEEEVQELQKLGYTGELNSLQTVGYKEVFEYLNGKTTHERMVELIKQNTRRFAKRQLTWFRRDKRIRWFDVRSEEDLPAVASRICRHFLE